MAVVAVDANILITARLARDQNHDRLDGDVGEYDTDYHPRSPDNMD